MNGHVKGSVLYDPFKMRCGGQVGCYEMRGESLKIPLNSLLEQPMVV